MKRIDHPGAECDFRISSGIAAREWGMTVEQVKELCRQGAIPGAREVYPGGHWSMPANTKKPKPRGN